MRVKIILKAAKARKMTKKAIRKAVGKQLRYVKRDLGSVDRLLQKIPKTTLNRKQQQDLETIQKSYQQQKTMYETRTRRIDDRIVSISQPHVRPIVRGKASAETEFGAKLSISVVKGYARVEKLSWENYNEGIDLIEQAKIHRERYGFFPEAISADKIYRNHALQDSQGRLVNKHLPPLKLR